MGRGKGEVWEKAEGVGRGGGMEEGRNRGEVELAPGVLLSSLLCRLEARNTAQFGGDVTGQVCYLAFYKFYI